MEFIIYNNCYTIQSPQLIVYCSGLLEILNDIMDSSLIIQNSICFCFDVNDAIRFRSEMRAIQRFHTLHRMCEL